MHSTKEKQSTNCHYLIRPPSGSYANRTIKCKCKMMRLNKKDDRNLRRTVKNSEKNKVKSYKNLKILTKI
jgi:pentose-5-phosphate-3-epimerase